MHVGAGALRSEGTGVLEDRKLQGVGKYVMWRKQETVAAAVPGICPALPGARRGAESLVCSTS